MTEGFGWTYPRPPADPMHIEGDHEEPFPDVWWRRAARRLLRNQADPEGPPPVADDGPQV